jgi:predicted TIM-barrel enzyme
VIGAYVTGPGDHPGLRRRARTAAALARSDVLIFGDVHVKHAHPLFDVPDRVRGAGTRRARRRRRRDRLRPRSPIPPTWERLGTVKEAVELPVLIGSGIGLENVKEFYERCRRVLIGEPDFKVGGVWGGETNRPPTPRPSASAAASRSRAATAVTGGPFRYHR